MNRSWQRPESIDPLSHAVFTEGRWHSRSNLGFNNFRFNQGSRRQLFTAGYLNLMAQLYNEQLLQLANHSSLTGYYNQSLLALTRWKPQFNDHRGHTYANRRQARTSFPNHDSYNSRQWQANEDHVGFGNHPRWRRESLSSDQGQWRRNDRTNEIHNDQRMSNTSLTLPKGLQEILSPVQNQLSGVEAEGRVGRKIQPPARDANGQETLPTEEDKIGRLTELNTCIQKSEDFSTLQDSVHSEKNPSAVQFNWNALCDDKDYYFVPMNFPDSPSDPAVEIKDDDTPKPSLENADSRELNNKDTSSNENVHSTVHSDTNSTQTTTDEASKTGPCNWFSQEEQQLIVKMFIEVDVRHEQQLTKNREQESEQMKQLPKNSSPPKENVVKETGTQDQLNQISSISPSGDFRHESDENPTQEESSSSEDGLVIVLPPAATCSDTSNNPSECLEENHLDASRPTGDTCVEESQQEESNIHCDWGRFCSGWERMSDSSRENKFSTTCNTTSDLYWPPNSDQRINETFSSDLKKLLGIGSETDDFQLDLCASSGFNQYYADLTSDDETEALMASMIVECHDNDDAKTLCKKTNNPTQIDFGSYGVNSSIYDYRTEHSIFPPEPCKISPQFDHLNDHNYSCLALLDWEKVASGVNDVSGAYFEESRPAYQEKHSHGNSPIENANHHPDSRTTSPLEKYRSISLDETDTNHLSHENASRPNASFVPVASIDKDDSKTREDLFLIRNDANGSAPDISPEKLEASNNTATAYLKNLLGVQHQEGTHKISNSSNIDYTQEYIENSKDLGAGENLEETSSSLFTVPSSDILKNILGIPLDQSNSASVSDRETMIQKSAAAKNNENKTKCLKNDQTSRNRFLNKKLPETGFDSDSKLNLNEDKHKAKTVTWGMVPESSKVRKKNAYSSYNANRPPPNNYKETGNTEQNSATKPPADSTENSTVHRKRKPRRYRKQKHYEDSKEYGGNKNDERVIPLCKGPYNKDADGNGHAGSKCLQCKNSKYASVSSNKQGEIDKSREINSTKVETKKDYPRQDKELCSGSNNDLETSIPKNKNITQEQGMENMISCLRTGLNDASLHSKPFISKSVVKEKVGSENTIERKRPFLPKDSINNNGGSDTIRHHNKSIPTETKTNRKYPNDDAISQNLDRYGTELGGTKPRRQGLNRNFNSVEKSPVKHTFYRSYGESRYRKKFASQRELPGSKIASCYEEKQAKQTSDCSTDVSKDIKANAKKPMKGISECCSTHTATTQTVDALGLYQTNTEGSKCVDEKVNEPDAPRSSTQTETSSEETKSELNKKLLRGEFGNYNFKCGARDIIKMQISLPLCDIQECEEFKQDHSSLKYILPTPQPSLKTPSSLI